MTKKIIWLASYPKSGNTWFRIIISNLLGEDKDEVDINNLEKTPIASSRQLMEAYCGFSTSNFTHDEIDRHRPLAADLAAQRFENIIFRKCHDAYSFLEDRTPLLGDPAYYKAIYIIRNPLSIVASMANHNNVSLDKAIEQMANDKFALSSSDKKYTSQLRQKLFSWSTHVKSWTQPENPEVHVLRYEDIYQNPLDTLQKSLQFAGFQFPDADITNAYENSKFDIISEKEEQNNFKEKPLRTHRFFRKGKTDSWKEELNTKQAQKVIHRHWPVMKQYGYLTEEVLSFAKLKFNDLKQPG